MKSSGLTDTSVIGQCTHKQSQAEHSKGKGHLQKRNNSND